LVFGSRDQCLPHLKHGFSGRTRFSRQFFGLQFGRVCLESSRRQCWSHSDLLVGVHLDSSICRSQRLRARSAFRRSPAARPSVTENFTLFARSQSLADSRVFLYLPSIHLLTRDFLISFSCSSFLAPPKEAGVLYSVVLSLPVLFPFRSKLAGAKTSTDEYLLSVQFVSVQLKHARFLFALISCCCFPSVYCMPTKCLMNCL
jgi:hypothetical protein